MTEGIEFTPYDYIVDENLPAPQVQVPENCNVMVLNSDLPDVWGQQMEENVVANMWVNQNEGIAPLWVGNNEVWAVNEAAMENGDVWSEATVEGITKGLEEASIAKGKRKAEGDLVDFYTDYTDLWSWVERCLICDIWWRVGCTPSEHLRWLIISTTPKKVKN